MHKNATVRLSQETLKQTLSNTQDAEVHEETVYVQLTVW